MTLNSSTKAGERESTATACKVMTQVLLPKRKKMAAFSYPHNGKIFQPPLRISRTVEQIDQTNKDWRDNTSKLMFMAVVGLTPTEGWKGLSKLQLKIAPANPVVLAQIKERYRVASLKRLQVLRETEKIMEERMMKLVKFSQGPKYTSSVGTNSMSS